MANVAVVAIGRNEGERLKRCLDSAKQRVNTVIYVDSGSTDGSVEMARARGAIVVALDVDQALFTAARARNAGFARALSEAPHVEFVQFVDGDCEFEDEWLNVARSFLEKNTGVAAAFGRRRERFPERSIYNRLCDLEWAVPSGPARYFGGDVMVRTSAFQAVAGYREDLIAGEEPELCVRLRRAGWQIESLNSPMTIHDAAMMRFGQWWQRTRRAGYAFAEGAQLHGAPPERHWVRETRGIMFWGLLFPLFLATGAILVSPWIASLFLVYGLQMLRIYWRQRATNRWPLLTSAAFVIGKFPQAAGLVQYHINRLRGAKGRIIEYK